MVGALQVFQVTGQPSEPHEVVGRHRVSGRDGAVIDLFLTDQQLFVVGGGEKEATPVCVPEQLVGLLLERSRTLEVFRIECRVVELQHRHRHKDVVVEKGGDRGVTLAPTME